MSLDSPLGKSVLWPVQDREATEEEAAAVSGDKCGGLDGGSGTRNGERGRFAQEMLWK